MLVGAIDTIRAELFALFTYLTGGCPVCFGRGTRVIIDVPSRALDRVGCEHCCGTGRRLR